MSLWGANTASAADKPKWLANTGDFYNAANVIGANSTFVADANTPGVAQKGWVHAVTKRANASLGAITINAGGLGYANGRTLNITGGGGYGTGTSVSLQTNGTGGITGFNYTSNGSGFITTPTIEINQPLANVAINAAGSGYVNGQFLTVTGGGGSGANISITTNGTGAIASFTYNNLGNNYTSLPTVTAPTGTGANLTAVFAGTGANLTATLSGGNPRTLYETLVAL